MVEYRGELLRRESAVTLGHELTDVLPVGVGGDQHHDAIVAGPLTRSKMSSGISMGAVGRPSLAVLLTPNILHCAAVAKDEIVCQSVTVATYSARRYPPRPDGLPAIP